MPDFRSDKATPLHGTVGSLSELKETAAPGTADDTRIRIFMSGDGMSSPGAVGLDEDLRLLVEAFVQGSRSGAREMMPARSASDGAHGDVEIALHGLDLIAEEKGELHHLIRELVSKRVAGEEATK